MTASDATPAIHLAGVTKIYGNGVRAVDALELRIREGEFFSLLGPSGCGKTTTLRMIAGFEEPTAGRLFIRGREMTHVPAHRRDIGMVFQNYALFPHRTVVLDEKYQQRLLTTEEKVKQLIQVDWKWYNARKDEFNDRYNRIFRS